MRVEILEYPGAYVRVRRVSRNEAVREEIMPRRKKE
jgi:hypothetical protein